jgi:hypothetical protein
MLVGSYFSWMQALDLPSLMFNILLFNVEPTTYICDHSAYKRCPLILTQKKKEKKNNRIRI